MTDNKPPERIWLYDEHMLDDWRFVWTRAPFPEELDDPRKFEGGVNDPDYPRVRCWVPVDAAAPEELIERTQTILRVETDDPFYRGMLLEVLEHFTKLREGS